MSAPLSVRNARRFQSDDPNQAIAEETDTAWRKFFGYWGTFKVIPEHAANKKATSSRDSGGKRSVSCVLQLELH